MSCSCNNSQVHEFDIVYLGNDGFEVRLAGTTEAVTSCGGSLYINLTGSDDCAKLIFNYEPNSGDPEVSPMATNGSCPCEVASSGGGGAAQTITGIFQPPSPGTCRYLWTLYTPQPPCRIDIVVSKW